MTWKTTTLRELLIERKNRFKPSDTAIANFKRVDKIDFSGKIHLSDKGSNTDMILVKKGDLLISGINVHKGALAVYQDDADVVATIHYSSYQFDEKKIFIDFLKAFLKSENFLDALKQQVPGGIKTEIKPKHLLPLKILIPNSVEEQQTLIEIYLKKEAQVRAIQAELQTQQTLLTQLRQAILQEAVQGKLTEKWRAESEVLDSTETGGVLLARIRAEKAELIRQGKLRKEKPLPPITDAEKPFELPEGWVWCRLGEVNNISSGITLGKKYYESLVEVPYLRVANVQRSYIDLRIIKTLKVPEKEAIKYRLSQHDILVNEGGDYDKVGRAAKWLGQIENCIHQNHLFKVQVLESSPDWITTCINADYSRAHFLKGYVKTTNLASISSVTLRTLTIPLPPLAEQQAIVTQIEQLLNQVDALETENKLQQAEVGRLMQAVLREAFAGKTTEVDVDVVA